jgi:transcription-repair coupling factor (superfamily II helicase)
MPEGQIKQVLQDFLDKKCDLLLSSTIIENGIDIPNANAIIIDEAENYGLSQIHQLRGRVGRSSTQAYAYLFYTKDKQLQQKAIDRLEAIREYVALGSGHDLALKDLEIRGAGNVLGKEQHGHIISVGFNLYCKLINEAISEKLGRKKEVEWLDLDANFMMIPESYISDPRQRVALYIRFYKCISIPELQQIKEEIEDRYGKITEEVKQVFDYVRSGIYELSYSD